ncbi:hypothetical protein BO83DRAFT_340479 [Aspergillus eucalypticola CBS 122712]|uniref:Something about silencing protein 4 domain-containing protein n=1 Tax=Aspergillus eucalypticola (strain CBS 122712 / IBT 29274) TaxID=1448314 RepID=A0A317VA27_ASPEC|nr:uncharacterized protein BO83DRAFT_340479 [Aspergillus eucalypticola CBS 122712]PWY69877.1 hypothetical protein BO83DRAFT_340479 [Aspergillus eucalypticola CBS 122712]
MTSTTLMPVRVSLRRDPPHHGHSPDQPDSEPPAKRARLQTQSSSRRRKSSPDLLDTTTTENSSSSAATPYKLSSHHPLRRRTSTRRPLASNNPTSSSPATPRPNPRPNPRRILRNDSTPTITSYFLPVGRESPDPLDTISPSATANSSVSRRVAPAGTPSAVTTAASSSARRPRRSTAAADPEPEAAATPIQQPTSASIASNLSQPAPDATPQQPTVPTEQPSTGREQRRSLRSHDGGSRARSELALYFPNYEELLSMEPPKTEFLAGNTTIKLLDDLHEPLIPSSDPISDTDTPFGNPLVNLHNCETITLPDSSTSPRIPPTAEDSPTTSPDPLSEETYFRPHRRNERQEKQLRNIERDRAQHEKQNLDRLLDDLQGHDWLRVMGITGLISDPERKHFESKRTYFIREISAVLQKFKIWREEEKRRKSEKDKPAEEEPVPPTTASSSKKDHSPETTATSTNGDPEDGTTPLSDAQSCGGDPPDPNDVDAWAARQLHQEARSATTTTTANTTNPTATSTSTGKKLTKPSSSTKHKATASNIAHPPPPPPPPPPAEILPPEPTRPFTSFYSKPHLRELALAGPARKGRTRLAFGQPIPEIEEREFELPAEILTPEAIDSCRRKRRRMKRASGRGETG